MSRLSGLCGGESDARADVFAGVVQESASLAEQQARNTHILRAFLAMRMRGLEPPPSYLDTDLNRARLPIPPHPHEWGSEDIVSMLAGPPCGLLGHHKCRKEAAWGGCASMLDGGSALLVALIASTATFMRRHRLGD